MKKEEIFLMFDTNRIVVKKKEGAEMNVLDAIRGRRSIRKYSSRPVEDQKLDAVLEAGRLSPSAGNRQSWKFVVVRDPEIIKRLSEEASGGQTFIGEAPLILAACGTNPERIMMCGQYSYSVDLSIATAYMILAAYEQGLGTCWLGAFDENKVKEILGIPKEVRVVALTPLGYPAESPAARPRKSLGEIVCYDRFE
ncbi:MAG: nitroreductase family protein [Saccharofermentanales bacterium]